LANYGFVTWLPTVLRGLGYTGATSSGYLALSALVALPALAITTLLVTRWSTRWTLATFALGGGLALAALGAGAAVGWLTPLSLVVVTGIAFFFLTSIGSVFSPYAAEVFPTQVRARRSGTVAAASRFGGVVGPFFGGLSLTASGSVLGLQLPLAAMLVLAAAVMALAGVETRGRTLEQIDGRETQESLASRPME
jgi:putative MFS transporter